MTKAKIKKLKLMKLKPELTEKKTGKPENSAANQKTEAEGSEKR